MQIAPEKWNRICNARICAADDVAASHRVHAAAALAENGRFNEAIDVQKKAITLVDHEENEDYRAELIARLDDIISRSSPSMKTSTLSPMET